jgi:DSF synthase
MSTQEIPLLKSIENPNKALKGPGELSVSFDQQQSALWFYMHGKPRPTFTPGLLSEMQMLFSDIKHDRLHDMKIDYLVAASSASGVFNLGGDLTTFQQYITNGDANKLREYAYACTDMGYECYRHFNKGITTIALIQGDALGGGFEAALSCNILIAEEHVKIGFPEIMFNLFPGMGAYSYLSRRTNTSIADKMISSGKIYSAQELYDMGIIDRVVPSGEGHHYTSEFIREHRKSRHGRLAMQRAKHCLNTLTLDELHDIADIWVEAALHVDSKELKVMDRLIRAQSRRMLKSGGEMPEQRLAG